MTDPLQGVHLHLGKVLQQINLAITIDEETDEEINSFQYPNFSLPDEDNIPIPQNQATSQPKKPQVFKVPPYLERLALEKPVAQFEFNV